MRNRNQLGRRPEPEGSRWEAARIRRGDSGRVGGPPADADELVAVTPDASVRTQAPSRPGHGDAGPDVEPDAPRRGGATDAGGPQFNVRPTSSAPIHPRRLQPARRHRDCRQRELPPALCGRGCCARRTSRRRPRPSRCWTRPASCEATASARPGSCGRTSRWSRRLHTQSDHRLWETAALFHLRGARPRRYGDFPTGAAVGGRRRCCPTATCRSRPARTISSPSARSPSSEGLRRLAAAVAGRCGRRRDHRRQRAPRREDGSRRAGRGSRLWSPISIAGCPRARSLPAFEASLPGQPKCQPIAGVGGAPEGRCRRATARAARPASAGTRLSSWGAAVFPYAILIG